MQWPAPLKWVNQFITVYSILLSKSANVLLCEPFVRNLSLCNISIKSHITRIPNSEPFKWHQKILTMWYYLFLKMVWKCVCIFSMIVYSLYKEGDSTGVRAQTLKADCLLAVSCLTLCNPVNCHGILQARILEWVAVCFSRGSSQSRDWTCISCIAGRFFTTEPSGKPTWKLMPGFKCCSAVD